MKTFPPCSGELAYYSMQHFFAWAKYPMLPRLRSELSPSIPLTVVCGSKSWLRKVEQNTTAQNLVEAHRQSFVSVHEVEDAGHHVHADKPTQFNNIITDTLELIDSEQDII